MGRAWTAGAWPASRNWWDGAPSIGGNVNAQPPVPTRPGDCFSQAAWSVVLPTATPNVQATQTAQAQATGTAAALPREYYAQFKGIIFWAIYNETNENQQIPLYEALPRTDSTIDGTINDRDHRYLMARTILNNIPLNDISGGVGFMQRWGGSIGSTNYPLWLVQQGKIECKFGEETVALSYEIAKGAGDEAILLWFNGYMECFRTGENLQNTLPNFDEAYSAITGFINDAINDHVNGNENPVSGAEFVKHTSTCFVWQRDANGNITSCYGDGARINMQTFCAQSPYVRPPADMSTPTPTPIPNRNCRVTSSINPGSVVLADWLALAEGRDSSQQLGLETVVGRLNEINLGLYTDDQPYNCGGASCYFLLGNPTGRRPNEERQEDISETRADAWERHQTAQTNEDYGYRGFGQGYFVHVLRIEPNGEETWITTVFQLQA
jgi:hypothetical protein